MAKKLPSEVIRDAINNCGISRYELSKRTGVTQSVLSRFVAEGRHINTETLDRIAAEIGLTVSAKKPSKTQRKAK